MIPDTDKPIGVSALAPVKSNPAIVASGPSTMSWKVAPPSVLTCHCTLNGVSPEVVTENSAVEVPHKVTLAGCVKKPVFDTFKVASTGSKETHGAPPVTIHWYK